MFARMPILGLAATLAMSPSFGPGQSFTLESTGALVQAVTGTEARYSISPDPVEGRRELAIALGINGAQGALWLFTAADEPLRPGRYPVSHTWTGSGHGTDADRRFHACYMPGTAEHPLGMFHSESGWVTITEAAPGRIAGTFELRARGFLAANAADENQWVTVRGTFAAEGDGQVVTVEAASRAGQ
jgi:hypothetical protein